jgi:hypothetical protein
LLEANNFVVASTSVLRSFLEEEEQSRYDVLSSSAEIQVKAGIATLIDNLIGTGGVAGRANA